MLKRTAKPSDLNQELASWSHQDVIFLVTESMSSKFNIVCRDIPSPVSGDGRSFGHIVVPYSTYEDVSSKLSHFIFERGIRVKIVFILPSFSDFRHFALLEYTDAQFRKGGAFGESQAAERWSKIARFIKPEWQIHQVLAIAAAMDAFDAQWGMEFRRRHITLKYNLNGVDHDYVNSRNPDLITGLGLRVLHSDEVFRYCVSRSNGKGEQI